MTTYADYTTGAPVTDTKAPSGPIHERWDKRRFEAKLVNPANRRKHTVIVVGTGLAGGSAGATLAEQGYHVVQFCYQDSPRRAHSIAAQGGINAAKNYRNDGDSIHRLFYDTVKGGDFRARESNVHRLAQISVEIIDQCVAQGVPFAREYGGLLDTRSFGGVQVSRTFLRPRPDGPAAAARRLPGAVPADRRRERGDAPAHRDARPDRRRRAGARGSSPGTWSPGRSTPTSRTPSSSPPAATATSSTCRPTPRTPTRPPSGGRTGWRLLRQPLLHPDPPDLHPAHRRPPVQAHADERVAAQRRPDLGAQTQGDTRPPRRDPRRTSATTTWSASYPSSATSCPATSPPRAKNVCDEGRGSGPRRTGRLPDFADAIKRTGRKAVEAKYGNLFDMYQRITDEDPYEVPMRIYPAVHYTMGGLWVDYDLQTTVPGLFAIGEANFSDHGANRLGASALMRGLADGYFVLPATINDYLARNPTRSRSPTDTPSSRRCWPRPRTGSTCCRPWIGDRTPDSFHRELGELMWEFCGMARTDSGLRKALERIPADPRGVLAAHQGARHRRGVQPVAGEGQPHRRHWNSPN